MSNVPRFQEGERVILPENLDEGWAREHGIVLAVEDPRYGGGVQMYIVEVDALDDHDDGLREVPEDGMAKYCRWFYLCDNPATGTLSHPRLGEVSVCDRCRDLVGSQG